MKVNQIIHGDCLEIFINPADLVILDPPFNIWQDITGKTLPFLKQKFLANTYICFTNFQNRFYVESVFGLPRFEIVWYFKNGRWVSNKLPRITHENILIYGQIKNEAYSEENNPLNGQSIKKGKSCIGRDKDLGDRVYTAKPQKMLNSVIEIPKNINAELGVWGKPIKLIRTLIKWLTNESDLILDPFSGSGTTAIACLETNRNYICIEKDKTYYDLSVKRVNDYLSQINMEFI